ncbi:DNA/RNA helicase, DEAD/DEAH box type, N-terminal [Artemisia annua]|uniref:DNA/RNA helicase, DEAD/DEAH box type, N-terminal n=1 Tax=Artemisia annua TaxID=35608 RepID=A0A2U1Q6W6_ARTAN|nr:DNA/RNA helicase, DEAD/DEAH box type, N-terminal [Artemisia annua]
MVVGDGGEKGWRLKKTSEVEKKNIVLFPFAVNPCHRPNPPLSTIHSNYHLAADLMKAMRAFVRGIPVHGNMGFRMFVLVQNELKDHLKLPDQNFSSMMESVDEDVEKSSLADQDDVGSGPAVDKIKVESTVIQVEAKRLIQVRVGYFKSSTTHSELYFAYECISDLHQSSRSGDHRRSRRDSPESDRREAVKVGWSQGEVPEVMIWIMDYRDRSEPSPRHGRDYRDCDNKRERYEV